jgi:hypothetical protein
LLFPPKVKRVRREGEGRGKGEREREIMEVLHNVKSRNQGTSR